MAMRDNEARRQKRLVDYVCLVGIDHLACNEDDVEDDCNERAQQPQLLRRFPAQNHPDCKSKCVLRQQNLQDTMIIL